MAHASFSDESAGPHHSRPAGLPFSPRWLQDRLLALATRDPSLRTSLLRLVDVLPALRDDRAVATHVRQYLGDSSLPWIARAVDLAGIDLLRPITALAVQQGVARMGDRFIAGQTPADALSRLRRLAGRGIGATIDLLGEATLSTVDADRYHDRYLDLLRTLIARESALRPAGSHWVAVPPLNVSLKFSAFTASFEPAAPESVVRDVLGRLEPVVRLAQQHGVFLNVDLEQHRYRDLVHRIFEQLAGATSGPLGIVVQAYLTSAEQDVERIRRIAEQRGQPITVRLVKGAYWDEERIVASQNHWPIPVYEQQWRTEASYERCTDQILAAWPHLIPAFGTHNAVSIRQAIDKARQHGRARDEFEFQVLYGMAEDLRDSLAGEGYRIRVYAPVGDLVPGMAYLVRRLLENTSNQAWFVGGGEKGERGRGEKGSDERRTAVDLPTQVAGRNGHNGSIAATAAFGAALAEGAQDRSPGRVHCPPAQFHDPQVRESMQTAIDSLRNQLGKTHPLPGRSVRPIRVVRHPADRDLLVGRVEEATIADVDPAVRTARSGFDRWAGLPVAERALRLRRAADAIEADRFNLAALMIFESGKPWREADGDIVEAVEFLRYYADQAERLFQPQSLESVLGETNTLVYEPRGVAAVIAPWNFPLAILTGMTAGALVTGNAVIVKPAEQSPLIARRLVEVLHDAGVPRDAVQLLAGEGEIVGRALVEHPEVDLIVFTGSSAVGQAIIAEAARPRANGRGFKKVIAEMGGKNAIIVDEDADLDEAVAGILASSFGYAGQKCSAASRVIAIGATYGPLRERLANAVRSLNVGPPDNPATQVPPVIDEEARARIERYVALGRTAGTVLVEAPAPTGACYVAPIVLEDLPLNHPAACEEIFGPVVALFRAPDLDEAIRIAADSRYALTGGLYSRNPTTIARVRRELRVGNLYINRKITGAVVGRQPFGGLGLSGIGDKAGGPDYLRQFVEARTITENTVRHGFAG